MLTSGYVDCQPVCWNLQDLPQGEVRQNTRPSFPSRFEPYFYRASGQLGEAEGPVGNAAKGEGSEESFIEAEKRWTFGTRVESAGSYV
jgi:hypothetical protein